MASLVENVRRHKADDPLRRPLSALLAVFALKKCVLHFIVDQNQPFLRGSGTLPKVICLRLKLTRSLLNSAQLRRKLVCEVHGSRAIFLGSFSRFV